MGLLWDTVCASVKEDTWKGYERVRRVYLEWCRKVGMGEEWGEDVVLAAYVAHLGVFRKWRGIRAVLKGLKAWFRLTGIPYPREAEVVKRAFAGVKKRQKGRVNKKEPVRIWMLRRVSRGTEGKRGVRNLLLLLVGFFVLLRVSELVKIK